MDDWKHTPLINKPIHCTLCQGKLSSIYSGQYKCSICGNIEFDDFGKVKKFLEENGPCPVIVIAERTSVSVDTIEFFLKEGLIEITEQSNCFLSCERCHCSIRSGRFCINCAKQLAGGIQKLFFSEIGEKPKTETHIKMRYFDKK